MKNDEKIIIALLESSSVTQAAEKCGISRDNLYKKMTKAAFQALYDKARTDALQHATARLCGRLGSALDIIEGIANDTHNAPQIRLNAAQILINATTKLNEQQNLQRQIDELEARLKGVSENAVLR